MGKLIDAIDRIRGRARDTRWDPRVLARPLPRFEVEGRKILLVYLFSGLGDAILLAPVIEALLALEPKAVGVLVPPLGARFFKTLDRGLTIHVFKEEDRGKIEASIARRRYDVAVDVSLREGIDSRSFLAASQAKTQLGFLRERETLERARLTFGAPDTRTEAAMHWSRYLAMPLRVLGVERPSYDLEWPKAAAKSKAALALFGDKKKPRVVLIPGGRADEKRWDDARFVAVGRWARDHGARIVVCGGPDESKLVRSVVKRIGASAKPYTGKDLVMLQKIIAGANAVVTNDTGPMHLAFLSGAPTIAIFRHMSPVVWGPPKSDPRFVIIQTRGVDRGDDRADVFSRLVVHHLEGLLARRM